MFFCLPIFFGCQTKIKPEGEQVLRLCPRCHNVTVFPAKSTTWFELFWVPIVPISKKHMWLCGTCQWKENVPKDQVGLRSNNTGPSTGAPLQTWIPPNQPGYQPAYIGQPVNKT
ncbi:hypothetical protein B0H34DRAFT_694273 [Crassisporium funariophilum]|nr:hypothetical protein B0H34DRAFT_694273 [Crassisporium funariophilum]